MSKKWSRYKRQNRMPVADKQPIKNERGLFASDGYTNPLAYIG